MKTCITPGMYPERRSQMVPYGHHLKLPGVVRKEQEMGMTPTPLANASPGGKRGVPGKETIAIPERAKWRGGVQSR